MEKLPLKFEGKGDVKGFTFTQLERTEKVAFYEVLDNETNKKHYEVFDIQVQQEQQKILSGVSVKLEHKELYPRTQKFGISALCFSDYLKASNMFARMKK